MFCFTFLNRERDEFIESDKKPHCYYRLFYANNVDGKRHFLFLEFREELTNGLFREKKELQ